MIRNMHQKKGLGDFNSIRKPKYDAIKIPYWLFKQYEYTPCIQYVYD